MVEEKALLARIDDALAKGDRTHASQQSTTVQASRVDPRHTKVVGWVDIALAAEFRAAGGSLLRDLYGESNPFYRDFMAHTSNTGQPFQYRGAVGILRVAKEQVQRGWLARTRGLIAGEVFSDFLDMAQHLLEEGYKERRGRHRGKLP